MRCKNCGAKNDESRFICENCGSPLYDENEEIINENQDDYQNDNQLNNNNNDDKDNKKRNIIIISIISAVVVIALIVGLVFAFSGKSNKEPSESQTVSISVKETEEETTTKKVYTTKEQTTKQTTTEAPTTTTTTTTTVKSFHISVDIDGNGTVSGEGSYESGKKATLVATPEQGYQFAGWYDNSTGALVASGSKYTVTVKKDLNLTAKFTSTGAKK